MDKREFVDHFHNNNQEEAPGSHAEELIEGLAVTWTMNVTCQIYFTELSQQ
jgi:hypothetical protein